MPFYFYVVIGISAALGYAIPPRAGPWWILATIAVIALLWLTYDGAFHQNPLPLLLTPVGIALIVGIAIRLAHAAIRAACRERAKNE
jgi:hypothetical protein